VLAGLGGCAVAGSTTGSTAPTTAPATAASAAPAKVLTLAIPQPRTAAPALATTGTAWPKVLASLSAYGQWLLANPDLALVGNVTTPGCAVAELLSAQVQGLITENAYVVTTPPTFTAVTGPTPAPTTGQAVLMVTAGRAAEPVVSRAKKTVTIASYDAVPPASFEVTLDRGADGKWRYCTIENQPDETVSAVPLI
jgi:hypothetical protein